MVSGWTRIFISDRQHLFPVIFYRQQAFCALLMLPRCLAFLEECSERLKLKNSLFMAQKSNWIGYSDM